MTLAPGSKLGPYEIVAPLGAGGMGEVHRARDPRLGREVAIKVLPSHLVANSEARARFEREARSVSSLNHPNICVLHDVGREGDTDFLVMELIEGETLAERIARGPLPIGDVLRIGAQIAGALDRAHRAGVVHRDLKPANVMLTKSGTKLMDFGLARMAGPGAAGLMTQAPTAVDPVTAQGTILGTFQYMAPEQLEAREADARTDLWALGCVLYEMATGARPFAGGTSASLISAILRDTPRPMIELVPLSPPPFERAVKQCLAKDPDDRWQSAGDLKRELEWIAGGSGASAVTSSARRRGRVPALAGVALGVLAILLLAWMVGSRGASKQAIDAAIAPPSGVQVASPVSRFLPLAISRDGTRIAFVAHETEGVDRLWVRSLSNGEAKPLAGTERPEGPFFSPDGRSIGFFALGKLKRVDLDGGLVTILADSPDPRGGSWASDGTILYSPTGTGAIYRISADGGAPVAVTTLDSARGEATHRYPHVLPDGKHFLYLARKSGTGAGRNPIIYVGDVRGGKRVPVLEVASNIAYASGHVLYVRQGALVAQPYDLRRNAVHGRAQTVMADVSMDERFSRASFAVSQHGVLLALTGRTDTRAQLRWRGRDGRHGEAVGEPADYAFGGTPCISPDGRSAAMAVISPERGNADIWIVDLASGRSRRLTTDTEDHYSCIWSHDGQSIVLTGGQPPSPRYLASRPVQGLGGMRKIVESPSVGGLYPVSQSPTGAVLFSVNDLAAQSLWIASRPEEPPVRLLPKTVGGQQWTGEFSSDGRFVAYDSDETGQSEIFVTPYPWTGERWQVSQEGGSAPRWGRNGREIFYMDLQNRLMSVDVAQAGDALEFGTIRRLFSLSSGLNSGGWLFDESPDGRFLVVEPPTGTVGPPVRLLTHWTARLNSK
jgi:Tol biopolymer transport system component